MMMMAVMDRHEILHRDGYYARRADPDSAVRDS
jgi:hypothetical protein